MADFVDDRAAEEPEAEEAEEDDGLPEDEEEASDGSGSGSDDDSSEEGDDEDEFENDGFIVDEAEDEGDAGGDEQEGGSDVEGAAEAKKRRKKKRRRELVLDEEDYELLEDNTGIRRQRPQQQHRRIKKARDATAGGSSQQQDAARALQEELFGLEDDGLEDEDDLEDIGPSAGAGGGASRARPGSRLQAGGRDEARLPEADDQFEEDEDDWLVHEDEEEGGAAAGQRRRRRRAALEGMPGIDPDALAEADEIFGNVDDLLAMYEDRKRSARGGEEDEEAEEDLEGDEDLDDEAAEQRRLQREERQRAAAARRVQEQLEPEAVARHFMLPKDEQIRETDLPEREQLHRGPDPANFDLAACAAWIWEHLLGERRPEVSKVQELLEDGIREVEGPPPPWYRHAQWQARDLAGDLQDIGSHRALYRGREGREERRAWRHNKEAQAELRACIQAVLRQVYQKHEEVPFVAQYRKELCGELLVVSQNDEPHTTRSDESSASFPAGVIRPHHRRIRCYEVLFAVHQLAQRWRALQVRREARQRAFERTLSETMHSEEQAAIQACLELLRQAESMEELEDCETKFRLATQQFAPEDVLSQLSLGGGGGAGGTRRPQKATGYLLCLRAGLSGFVAGLGLSASQLAENVEAGYKKHIPVDLQVTPLEHATQFVAPTGGFSTPEAVLKGGCHMAATEIAAEPLVRQEARKSFQEVAVVSTAPTPAGQSALDPFHPLGSVKRLANKPLRRFEGSDQFLRLLQAEKEGLITVTFSLDEERPGEALLSSLSESYLSGGLSEAAQAWDELRRQVLTEAVMELLLPVMEREARTRMAAEARTAALEDAAERLWGYASQAPLQVKLVDDDEVEPERRVMAVCYGTGNPATTFVMLDPAGNLVDFLHCPQFSGPIPRRKALPGVVYSMFDDAKKGQDAARIRSFIEDHKPHAIVIGASHPEARTLEQDLMAIRESILLDNPRFQIELGTGDLQILMADESVAAVWENSAAGREELAATSAPIVRRAVALGRQLLDPLALLASLCSGGKEVLALQLHPLQAQLSEEERLGMVERVMTTAVSQVGIDLNAVAGSTWQSAPLQFVPGLGPRKAAALLRAVARAGGFVESRQQVWRELGVFGNRVFRNAAPYLRIRASAKGTANLELDPLDDTRIHPEAYKYATAMAQSAVGAGEAEAGDDAAAIENAFARPQEVESLDLVFYDEHLRREEGGGEAGEGGGLSKLATLIDIQMEFVAPYGELRRELMQLKQEDVFWLCSGETKATLKPGRKVEARVRYVGESDARCVLADINNIEAVIERGEVSRSAGDDINVRDFLKPNDTVTARIVEVEPKFWQVKLSTRSDTLNDDLRWEHYYLHEQDKYYKLPSPDQLKQQQELQRRKNALKFVPRPIQHPLFKNISMADAASQLQEADVAVGECILRPSARGPKYICITMKLPESIWHLDLEEQGKSAASLKLGSSLVMEVIPGGKRETYEDLDEVAARFVEPVQERLRKLVTHRKWKALPWEKAQEELRQEKAHVPPQMAVYCLGPDNARAGMFYLGHVLSVNPRREYFMVTPDGYYFRRKEYPSVDAMIMAFRKQPRVPPELQRQEPPQQQQAPLPPPQQQQPLPPPRGMMAGQGGPGFYPGQQQQQPGMYGGGGGGGYPQQPGMYGGGGGYGGAPAASGGGGEYWPPEQGGGYGPSHGGGYGPPQGSGYGPPQGSGYGPPQGFHHPPQQHPGFPGFMPHPQPQGPGFMPQGQYSQHYGGGRR